MSLFDCFGKLLRPEGQKVRSEVLCPRCEKPLDERHNEKECASGGFSRRFFFGLAGASAAALALRLEGVPLPPGTARHIVVARAGDRIWIDNPTGPFDIHWDRPREDKERQAWDESGGLIPASDTQGFMPNEAGRIYVDGAIREMRIVAVTDRNTQKPQEFRVIRAEAWAKQRADEKKVREAEWNRRWGTRAPSTLAPNQPVYDLHPSRIPRGMEASLRVPQKGDYRKIEGPLSVGERFEPREGGEAIAAFRPLPGWEMVYDRFTDSYKVEKFIPANLRRLKEKFPKNTSVLRLIAGQPVVAPYRSLPA